MKSEEVTTWGYSRDGERWCDDYATRAEALQAGAEDIARIDGLPAPIYLGKCRRIPLDYGVNPADLVLAFTLSTDAPYYLVECFIHANEECSPGGDLFEGLEPDDTLRAAIVPGITAEQATEAMREWLEQRSWLPGPRALEVADVEEIRLKEAEAACP